jgi:hypothetical protein
MVLWILSQREGKRGIGKERECVGESKSKRVQAPRVWMTDLFYRHIHRTYQFQARARRIFLLLSRIR